MLRRKRIQNSMKKNILSFILGALLVSFSSMAQLTVNGYSNYSFAGFDVLVEDRAVINDSASTFEALDILETSLIEITQFNIDQLVIDSLKAVPIFVDWNTTTGAAQYHPSRDWLIDNGYEPAKAKCVEISNVTNFVNWTKANQPYMVLHELAHAYHHRVLNYNSATITEAYNNAVSNNLYKNVSYHNGGGNYTTVAEAYALNNEFEYFGEITEAYFGLNDFYPFDYDDLEEYDIVGFDAAKAIWGDIKLSIAAFETNVNDWLVYPNPTRGMVVLDVNLQDANTATYEVFDILGNKILMEAVMADKTKITVDLNDVPNGLYFLRLVVDKSTKTFKVVKE